MKIKDLPQAIQERVFECQKEQGNEPNAELRTGNFADEGNFDWHNTKEESEFWGKIDGGDFSEFYERYPKKETPTFAQQLKTPSVLDLSPEENEIIQRALVLMSKEYSNKHDELVHIGGFKQLKSVTSGIQEQIIKVNELVNKFKNVKQ